MLEIRNLHAEVDGKPILKGIHLKLAAGETHAIMGPNGSGKSTLSQVIAGREDYTVTQGEIIYNGRNILELSVEERAREGIFIAFQYPTAIPGVNNMQFLRTAVNAIRKHRGEKELNSGDFLKEARYAMQQLDMNPEFIKRAVNDGFSGGEKKKNEILQMYMLKPRLVILDETDSGLDIDALQDVSRAVNQFRSPERSFLVVTHYQRLLDYIKPDHIHVLFDGRIVKSGGPELALELEQSGYDEIKAAAVL